MRRVPYTLAMATGLCLALVGAVAAAGPETAAPLPVPPPGVPPDAAVPGPAPVLAMPTPPPAAGVQGAGWLARWRWNRLQTRRKHQAQFLGYPEEFNEWPLGRSLYTNANTQVANRAAARMCFYDYDFVDGTGELNYRGRDKLAAVGAQLPVSFCPVVIERTPKTPGLDVARRQTILAELARGTFPVPAERVVIAQPIALGQRGVESVLVERHRLGTVVSGGALGGIGAGAGTGVGPGALDASGLSGSTLAGPGPR